MRWAGHVAHVGGMKNVYEALVGNKRKKLLRGSRHRWEIILEWIINGWEAMTG
jgi:hypothetical protein